MKPDVAITKRRLELAGYVLLDMLQVGEWRGRVWHDLRLAANSEAPSFLWSRHVRTM